MEKKYQFNILRTFLLVQIPLILLTAIVVYRINLVIHRSESRIITESISRFLYTGNYREAMLVISDLMDSRFEYIRYRTLEGERVFEYPPRHDASILEHWWITQFERDVLLKEKLDHPKIGSITYAYRTFHYWFFGILAWMMVSLVVYVTFYRYKRRLLQRYRESVKQREKMAIANLAQQVLHDLRSPLTSLEVAAENLDLFPEQDRIIIRGSLGQIKDLTYRLMNFAKVRNANTDKDKTCLLASLVESVCAQKRYQLKKDTVNKIEIKTAFAENSYHIFAVINPVEMKRIISNLINNAIEAMKDNEGIVFLKMQQCVHGIRLTVQDNGRGIEKELWPSIMERGQSFHKNTGSGLGLYHAKETLKKVGGKIYFESAIDLGTTFHLELKVAAVPEWFSSKIIFNANEEIIILDDDENIHRVWKQKFQKMELQDYEIKVVHFSKTRELIEYIKSKKSRRFKFLCDYEIVGDEKNGLDIIQELALQKKSYLVTSRYEEDEVQRRCLREGIKIVPKTLVPYFPIYVQSNYHQSESAFDLVHIDDDEILRWSWIKRSQEKKLNLLSLASPTEFSDYEVDKKTPIYIDENLGAGEKQGHEWAQIFHRKGYQNLFLATGYQEVKEHHHQLKYLKEIRDKSFPL